MLYDKRNRKSAFQTLLLMPAALTRRTLRERLGVQQPAIH